MREDAEWLKSLNVGSEVIIDNSNRWHNHSYKKVTVVKITPTGRLKLSDGSCYYSNGSKVGDRYAGDLKQITPEILELMKRRELLYKIDFDKFKGLLNSEKLEFLLKWQEEILKDEVKHDS